MPLPLSPTLPQRLSAALISHTLPAVWSCFVCFPHSGDATPCRMTGVILHSHVRYKEI